MKRQLENNKQSIIEWMDLRNVYNDLWKSCIFKILSPFEVVKLSLVCKRFLSDLKELGKLLIIFTRRCESCGLTYTCPDRKLSSTNQCIDCTHNFPINLIYKYHHNKWMANFKYEINYDSMTTIQLHLEIIRVLQLLGYKTELIGFSQLIVTWNK